jgi:hypothetical protein
MNSKEDERVAHCSVEEWDAGSIRVARVVVEIDEYLAGSYLTTHLRDLYPPFWLSIVGCSVEVPEKRFPPKHAS